MCSSGRLASMWTSWNREWTFVRCPTVDKSVVVVVELHLMEEDDLEWVEMLGLVVELELEDGSCCALGSCPQRRACLIRPYSSSVASSLLR